MLRTAVVASLVGLAAPALASHPGPSLGVPALQLRGGGETAPALAPSDAPAAREGALQLQLDDGGGQDGKSPEMEDAFWTDIAVGAGVLIAGIAMLPVGEALGPIPLLLIVGGGVYLLVSFAF